MSGGRGDVIEICCMRERKINKKIKKIKRNVVGMLVERIPWCLNVLAKKPGKPFNKGSIAEFFLSGGGTIYWRHSTMF